MGAPTHRRLQTAQIHRLRRGFAAQSDRQDPQARAAQGLLEGQGTSGQLGTGKYRRPAETAGVVIVSAMATEAARAAAGGATVGVGSAAVVVRAAVAGRASLAAPAVRCRAGIGTRGP